MNKKTITPNPQQPVDRIPTGQLPTALAELNEATLNNVSNVLLSGMDDGGGMSFMCNNGWLVCSFDAEDE